MQTLLLANHDVRGIVAHVGLDCLMDEVISQLTRALIEHDGRRIEVPPRSGFEYEYPEAGLIEWMPAMEASKTATVKIVGYHPANGAKRRLPTILSTAFTYEVGSGHLSAVVDATFATALRTGAASAIASRVLAPPESTVLGLIGCGAQAVTQLHALSRLFRFEKVWVYDIDARAVATIRQRAGSFGLDPSIEIAPTTAEHLFCASDIVCTQTSVSTGAGPVVRDGATRGHLHVNAVGSDFPGKTELPRSFLERSFVCPDFRIQALREGECQALSADLIGPELHELVKLPGMFEEQRGRTTVFDSTGWALEDHVAIKILVGHAQALGLGKKVQIEAVTSDPSNPYGSFVQLSGQSESKMGAG